MEADTYHNSSILRPDLISSEVQGFASRFACNPALITSSTED
ncbi:14448_t:CDS:1, partial [Gigaspora margarita]